MSQKIIVTVARDGATQVQTEGFVGPACKQASDFIERALGKRQSEQLTCDYFRVSRESQATLTQGNSHES